jgi:hypothetical protein
MVNYGEHARKVKQADKLDTFKYRKLAAAP